MKYKKNISEAVIKRLPRYYRILSELHESGEIKVSSELISKLLGYTASKVRQDLSNFGEFGQQGYGYDVEYLRAQIKSIIGLGRGYNMIVIGLGNIGKALSNYKGFSRDGFYIKAVFDIQIEKSYQLGGIDYLPESSLEQYISVNPIDIVILAVSREVATDMAKRVIALGIQAIWNFAPVEIECGENVKIENINMSESLYTLCYRLNN